MLSEDIQGLLDMFEDHEQDGIEIDGFGVRNLRAVLGRILKDANALERRASKPCIVQNADVISIMPHMQRKQLEAYGEQCGVDFIVHTNDEPDGAA